MDADDGFLLGQLVLGARPSFVILDRDPREDFGVLLDTQGHVRFAVQDGVIVRNELPAISPSPPGAAATQRGWRAYTPPPIAVPIRYYDSRKWNTFSSKPISGLLTGALVLDRQLWLSQDSDSEAQVGDLSEFEGGKIRVRDLEYRILILPNIQALPLETLEFIEAYARGGGIVIALERVPEASVGFLDHESKDARVQEIVQKVVNHLGDEAGAKPL